MVHIKIIGLAALVALGLHAQTNLSSPTQVLRVPGGSPAPGELRLCDNSISCTTFGDLGIAGNNAFRIKGRASSNGVILLQPGNVAGLSEVHVLAPADGWPGLVIQDHSVAATNGVQLWTNGNTPYFSLDGSDAGNPTITPLNSTQMHLVGAFNVMNTPSATSYVQTVGSGMVVVSGGNNRVKLQAGGPLGTGTVTTYDSSGVLINTLDGTGLLNTGGSVTVQLSAVGTTYTQVVNSGVAVVSGGNNRVKLQAGGPLGSGSLTTYTSGGTPVNTVDGGGLSTTGSLVVSSISGSTQCLQVDTFGVVSGFSAPCGGSVTFAAWSNYSPTIGNLSSTSTNAAKALQSGKVAFVRVSVAGTSNGSNPTFTLPFTPLDANQTFACSITQSGSSVACVAIVSGSTVTLGFYNNTAFANTQTYTVQFEGSYETT